MPKYRQLHTKILDSYDFSEMPDDFCRVFWLLLTVVVDGEGRAMDNPAWIRSKMFPLREDVSAQKINGAIDWLASRGMVIRYTSNGRGYFYLPTFKKYQTGTDKEGKSVLPTPDLLRTYSGESQEELKQPCIVVVSESELVSASALVDEWQTEERPNCYAVYEAEIGPLTPSISDELDMEEKENPAGYVEDAIRLSAKSNHRSLKYIQGILRNWRENGKTEREKEAPKPQKYTGPIILSNGERAEV